MKTMSLVASSAVLAILLASPCLAVKPTTSSSDLEARVAALEAAIGTVPEGNSLQAQIDALVGDVGTLEQAVDAHETAINTLKAEDVRLKDLIHSSVASAKAELEVKINQNKGLIDGLQTQLDNINADLAIKLDFINEICPSGAPMLGVMDDGSIVCDISPASTSGDPLYFKVVYNVVDVDGDTSAQFVTATCPEGFVVSSVGYAISSTLTSFTGLKVTRFGVDQRDPTMRVGIVVFQNNNSSTSQPLQAVNYTYCVNATHLGFEQAQ